MNSYLYKYRNITNDNLDECYNLQNLINNNATISSRRLFNDPYDSRFIFNKPTLLELKRIRKQLKGKELGIYKTWKNADGFTKQGNLILKKLEEDFNKLIDKYAIYSLTNDPLSESMWANYAGNHEGFCIKFKKELFGAQEVIYDDKLPTLDLLPMVKKYFGLNLPTDYGKEIHDKLFVKKKCWEYENEYRFIMSGKLENKDFFLNKYSFDDIESIIFGYKMKRNVKEYILEKTNFKFSQAIIGNNQIEIVLFDRNKHL